MSEDVLLPGELNLLQGHDVGLVAADLPLQQRPPAFLRLGIPHDPRGYIPITFNMYSTSSFSSESDPPPRS